MTYETIFAFIYSQSGIRYPDSSYKSTFNPVVYKWCSPVAPQHNAPASRTARPAPLAFRSRDHEELCPQGDGDCFRPLSPYQPTHVRAPQSTARVDIYLLGLHPSPSRVISPSLSLSSSTRAFYMPYPHSFDSAAGPTANGRAQAPTTPPSKHEMGSSSQKPISASLSSSPSSSSSSTGSSPPTPAARRARRKLHVGVFSKRKGVHYNSDGRVLNCRFCEILRVRDEQFLYEDDSLVVFRPLHPIVPSHILIVPRAHIRNVNQLTVDHVELLRRMRSVAEQVLHAQPACADHSNSSGEETQVRNNKTKRNQDSPKDVSVDEFPGHTMTDMDDELRNHHYRSHKPVAEDTECRFSFHVPPFNSIDHVHMHAFRGSTGYFGRIKYRTESWWCRSFDDVLARLELELEQAEGIPANQGLPAPVQGQSSLHRRNR